MDTFRQTVGTLAGVEKEALLMCIDGRHALNVSHCNAHRFETYCLVDEAVHLGSHTNA